MNIFHDTCKQNSTKFLHKENIVNTPNRNYTLLIERFCIPFDGIFKTESLSDRVRVRPAASRRWLSTKAVLHFVSRRVCLTVSWFRTSHRLVQEQMDQLTAHLLTAHEDRDLDEEELLLLLLTCGVEDAAASLSAPISVCLDQLDEEACVRRVRLLVCPRLLPAPVFSLSVLFDKKVSRGLLREAGRKRSGCTVTNSRATQSSRVGCPT